MNYSKQSNSFQTYFTEIIIQKTKSKFPLIFWSFLANFWFQAEWKKVTSQANQAENPSGRAMARASLCYLLKAP